ncbi:dephospho-CoA kinase [Thalassolituus maritimus]|uniref:Dephospho-CoA kinase n=2 Tax=Thalassolituus maritimus TaxID=484498 RepID=A0ABQ0A101_9GAMM
MFILGLTGGIGSGKSAASAFFRDAGITVVDADMVAREVVEPGEPAWSAIKERFGNDAINEDSTLNRAWLRQKVFSEPEERRWLEGQTHPRIRDRITEQLAAAKSPYAILESPLLFESGQCELVTSTLVVDVPEQLQVERASNRDDNDPEQIKRIIAAQLPRQERLQRADQVVDNSGSLDELYKQLSALHATYLAASSTTS